MSLTLIVAQGPRNLVPLLLFHLRESVNILKFLAVCAVCFNMTVMMEIRKLQIFAFLVNAFFS